MRDAAVGFQCPSCVTEGHRQTRQGRTAYGGARSGNPALTSWVLIGLNVAVWVAILLTGGRRSDLITQLALRADGGCFVSTGTTTRFDGSLTAAQCGGFYLPGVADGALWQILSNAFVHVQPWHIGFNMLALYVLGPQLETVLGRTRFLALYVLSALAGSTAVVWLTPSATATLGASGAIFGLLGALMVLAYKVNGDIRALLPWLLINAALTFVVPNISWQGHLGGFVGGVVVAAIVAYAPRGPRRGTTQALGLAALAAALLAAIAAHSAIL